MHFGICKMICKYEHLGYNLCFMKTTFLLNNFFVYGLTVWKYYFKGIYCLVNPYIFNT